MSNQPKVVIFGSGVIGGSVGGWIAENYENIYLLDQGPTAKALREKGVTLYEQGKKDQGTNVKVKVIESLDDAVDADIVAIGVKNYSLEPVCELIKNRLGDKPIIVGMQNGVVNQRILPKYFSKVVFCVVSYNAWMDEPGVIGYQKKGPLHVGALNADLPGEVAMVSEVFNKGVETHATDKIRDAAYSKLVINLTNSLTTLIGLGFREIPNRALFQKLLTGLTWEGVQIVKAAGVKESKLGGMPPWIILWAGSKLPRMITKGLFENNVKKMVISSMGQDVLQRGSNQNELDTLNGEIVALAEKHGTPAPMNKAIYELCKREFAKEKFEPLSVEEVWRFVQSRS